MKTQINTLPKYWVVKCDTNNPNWRKVIDYLENVIGEKWEGCNNIAYYGYDGNFKYKGTNCFDNLYMFENNPTLLTIKQFVELTEKNEIPEYVECIDYWKGSKNKIFDTSKFPKLGNCSWEEILIEFNRLKDGSFKPSTKEAFDKQNSKKETMRTITHTQAQEIFDVACSTWKDTLFEIWGKAIISKQHVDISDDFYQEMRKACTSEQNELFDKIFGKDVKFKVGDWVIGWHTYTHPKWSKKAWQIAKINDEFAYPDEDGDTHFKNIKLATEEEIQKAKYIPEGTPCLARDNEGIVYKFVYSNGDGTFKSGRNNITWKEVQVLDINNLPKY